MSDSKGLRQDIIQSILDILAGPNQHVALYTQGRWHPTSVARFEATVTGIDTDAEGTGNLLVTGLRVNGPASHAPAVISIDRIIEITTI